MNILKSYILTALVFICVILSAENNQYPTIIFDQIVIHGQSNINEFSLYLTNELNSPKELKNKLINDGLIEFDIPVKYFKSDKRYLECDFRKMIQEDEYPDIRFLINKEEFDLINSSSIVKQINAIITIAGTTRKYPILVEMINYKESEKQVCGKVELLLTDFHLEPTSKIFGLIKVENKVVIDFRLILSQKLT